MSNGSRDEEDPGRSSPRPAVRRGLVAVVAAVAAGCTAHAGVGGRTWRELSTDRIVLVTDVDADEARERLREIDRLAAALTDIYAAILTRPPVRPRPVRLLHMADCAEVQARFGEGASGAVTRSVDFGAERIIVTCEIDHRVRNEVALHELTHDLNHRHLSDLPAWLQEGLATYYQTLRIDRDQVVVGLRPRMDRNLWRGVAILPSMSELRGLSQMDHEVEQLLDFGLEAVGLGVWGHGDPAIRRGGSSRS